MNHLKKVYLLALLLLIIGCNSKNELSTPASFEMVEQMKTGSKPLEIDRKLIKTGRIEFEVNELAAQKKNILEAITKYEGYIASDQEHKYDRRISNTISIRVPAINFDRLLNHITKGISKFDEKIIEVKDVTEEFLDVEARLKTKKELEIRYLEILKKASTVKEILDVERELGQLRSDIESIEGRLKYLGDQVSLATLTVTIYQQTSNQTQFGNEFKNGFKNGFDNLVWFFVLLMNIWPFILILVIALFLLKKWQKKKRLHDSSKNE